MQNVHPEQTAHPKKRRSSPWAEFSEQRRASARKYNDLCNELGMAFKEAQQDAYEQWTKWWVQTQHQKM
jgi:hypothetical protein